MDGLNLVKWVEPNQVMIGGRFGSLGRHVGGEESLACEHAEAVVKPIRVPGVYEALSI